MGEKLVSGSGKGNSAIRFWQLIYLLAAAMGVIFIVISRIMSADEQGVASILLFLGVFIIIAGLIENVIINTCIAKTKVDVYESGVEGMGVGKNFHYGAYRILNFKVSYDQITSVDITKNSITVYLLNMQYKIYVSNPDEIRDTIFQQQEK